MQCLSGKKIIDNLKASFLSESIKKSAGAFQFVTSDLRLPTFNDEKTLHQ